MALVFHLSQPIEYLPLHVPGVSQTDPVEHRTHPYQEINPSLFPVSPLLQRDYHTLNYPDTNLRTYCWLLGVGVGEGVRIINILFITYFQLQ